MVARLSLKCEGFPRLFGKRPATGPRSAVRLDVTVDEDIAAAVDFVKEQERGLWGIGAGREILATMIGNDPKRPLSAGGLAA